MSAWDSFALSHSAHLLQTQTWGELKSNFGWTPVTMQIGEQGALVLLRRLPLGLTLAYVPRGPLTQWDDSCGELMTHLDALCRARGALCLKLEPALNEPSSAQAALLTRNSFRPSAHTVQPRRSVIIDLTGSEADLLARMKQKTRYNIGLATKKEVTVHAAQTPHDLNAFLHLMRVTGARDNFGVHSSDYYRRAYELFHPLGQCQLFLAEYHAEPLAGVMTFTFGQQAWYFYGASSDKERNRMAPYLAQWEAIRWAKAQGALTYDLWGVYRFKRGWGGQLVRTLGAWDKVYNPPMYQAYLLYLRLRKQSLG